jgi:hypothetical protein
MILVPPMVAFMAPFSAATLACGIDFEKRPPARKSLNICNVPAWFDSFRHNKKPRRSGAFDRPGRLS